MFFGALLAQRKRAEVALQHERLGQHDARQSQDHVKHDDQRHYQQREDAGHAQGLDVAVGRPPVVGEDHTREQARLGVVRLTPEGRAAA